MKLDSKYGSYSDYTEAATARSNLYMWRMAAISLLLVIMLIPGCMFGMPYYSVWSQGMTGKAELSRAEQNRQIKVQEAKAYNEAVTLKAEGDLKAARLQAEAIQAIRTELGNKPEYAVRWEYIQYLKEQQEPNNKEVIYLPNGMMPVQEATRLK